MDMRNIEVRCARQDWLPSVSIALFERGGDRSYMAAPIEFREVAAGEIVQPAVTLNVDQAQQLMDELWRCGLRPTEGAGSAGALAATERHLQDMQGIAKALLRKSGAKV